MSDNPRTELWDLMEKVPFAMLVTDDNGTMRGRPMDANIDRKRGQIHFLTSRTAPKVEELHHDRQVAVTFSDHDSKTYISVSGTGTVSMDQGLGRGVLGRGRRSLAVGGEESRATSP